MIVLEPQSTTVMREVVRCDVCCKKITDKKKDLYVVAYNHLVCNKIHMVKYQLCEMCAFNRMADMDERRERIRSGVTDVEQETLLRGLFDSRGKIKKRKK